MDLHSRTAKKNTSHGKEYKDCATNEEVRAKIQQEFGPHDDLLTIGYVSSSPGLAKTILRGTVKEGRRQGRQKNRREDNIREWTGLEFAKCTRERRMVAHTTLAVKG